MIIKVKKKKKQMTNFPPRCAETSTTTASTVTTITTMDSEQFRKYGKEMVDYIADYYDNIRQRPVIHNVSPGYLPLLLPDSAPEDPEDWQDIFKDIEGVIMPGVS